MLSCPELLSPAGSLEALKYAVMYGADAVYCALPRFGMRAAPVNLTIGELHDGCIFAHARGKKVYLTLNNLPTNDELSELPQYIKDAAEAGVDAFIIADLGRTEPCQTVCSGCGCAFFHPGRHHQLCCCNHGLQPGRQACGVGARADPDRYCPDPR